MQAILNFCGIAYIHFIDRLSLGLIALSAFYTQAVESHHRMMDHLSQLTRIQSNVGASLVSSLKKDVAKSDLISNLQLIVSS